MAIDRIVRFMDGLERRLGGDIQYLVAKRYLRQGRFADALETFQRAEDWLAEERGPDHPYTIAAIVSVAYCHARMRNLDEACRHYDRALEKMDKIGKHDHDLAHRIREYVATACG